MSCHMRESCHVICGWVMSRHAIYQWVISNVESSHVPYRIECRQETRDAPRCSLTHCNTLQQHTATHHYTLQHTATQIHRQETRGAPRCSITHCNTLQQHTATHCYTLQNTHIGKKHEVRLDARLNSATRCNTLQHTATHCNIHI